MKGGGGQIKCCSSSKKDIIMSLRQTLINNHQLNEAEEKAYLPSIPFIEDFSLDDEKKIREYYNISQMGFNPFDENKQKNIENRKQKCRKLELSSTISKQDLLEEIKVLCSELNINYEVNVEQNDTKMNSLLDDILHRKKCKFLRISYNSNATQIKSALKKNVMN